MVDESYSKEQVKTLLLDQKFTLHFEQLNDSLKVINTSIQDLKTKEEQNLDRIYGAIHEANAERAKCKIELTTNINDFKSSETKISANLPGAIPPRSFPIL